MKKINVSEKCNGCGLCIAHCNYLREDVEGNAIPIEGMPIKNEDFEKIERIINDCQVKALSIIEVKNTNKTGKAAIMDLLEVLKKWTNNFSVKKVTKKDVEFNAKEYSINVPYSSKEYRRDYTSESQVKSAARDEFRNLCYSEAAYRPILKKLFVEYKINILKPYYSSEDNESSAYYSYNKEIRKLLADLYLEIQEICSGKSGLSRDWKEFSVYFNERDYSIFPLMGFDERSTGSGIISDLKERGKYTSLDWYVDRMDFDYDEMYDGEGFFGGAKYKKKWYFSGFEASAKEYIDDLKSSIGYMSGDISDGAADCVNGALKEFEKRVKEKLNEKISELERLSK